MPVPFAEPLSVGASPATARRRGTAGRLGGILTAACRRHLTALLAVLLMWWMAAGPVMAAALPLPVTLALERARIPIDAVAVWVQPVDAARPSMSINAAQAMNPASTMKLVTAFAALEALGPEYSWRTRIATTGPVRDGTLHGDLYLIGSGDPVLDEDRLRKLLRRLHSLGIRHVTGDLVLDGSALNLPPHDPQAFDGRGLRPYNSGADGLLLHYNTLQIGLYPAATPAAPVTVITEPPLAGLAIDNRLQTSDGRCDVWYRDLDAHLEPGPRLVLGGSLPASCGPRNWSAAPLPPPEYGIALVGALWAELGGTLDGRVRTGVAPAAAVARVDDSSPPLADVVRDMNKWSSNVIARQLLATLGAGRPEAANAVEGGAAEAIRLLGTAGIATDGLIIENGAGLSRIERIRADSLGGLLVAAWRRPWMPEFIAALPIAGVDGTARRRLADSPARGQAHIKTGTLNGVRAMAGYLLDRDGRRHALVMMVNHPEAAASQDAQDALLDWLWSAPPP